MTDTDATCAVNPRKQQLYRLYSADDELLYIGISYSAISRYAQHKAEKRWIEDVARIEIETHDVSRFEIERIEREAIIRETPRHNKAHNNGATSGAGYRATDPFDHSWMRQFVPDGYKHMQDAVEYILQAYDDYKAPGDTNDSVWVAWRQLLNSAFYLDMHDCTEPFWKHHYTLPYRRTPDGTCYYKCYHCGQSWTCWWATR